MKFQKFIEDAFNIDSNTSATIIITILVFVLGYIITSLAKGTSKFFLRQANRKLFIKNLETLITSLRKRQEVLQEQLKHLEIERITVVPLAKIQFFQAQILYSMGYKTSFECFFIGFENVLRWRKNKKLRNKAFVKVWENMANIEFWENNMYEQIEPIQKEINRINETMGRPLTEMRIYYTELFEKLKVPDVSTEERQFITSLQNIVSEWAKKENCQHGYIVNEFLSKKIKELCNNYEFLSTARQLRNFAMDASHWFTNLTNVVLNLQRSLKQYEYALSYFSRSTKKIVVILK